MPRSGLHLQIAVQNVPIVEVRHTLCSLVDQSDLIGMLTSFALEVCQNVPVLHCL